jgi:hypothetical protein
MVDREAAAVRTMDSLCPSSSPENVKPGDKGPVLIRVRVRGQHLPAGLSAVRRRAPGHGTADALTA